LIEYFFSFFERTRFARCRLKTGDAPLFTAATGSYTLKQGHGD
jgi:hypothetical protein